MVTIRLFIEGGVHAHNANAITASNTVALRESFNRLFNSENTNEKVKIVCETGDSDLGISKKFQISAATNDFLLIDLDNEDSYKPLKIKAFKLTNYASNVFFMVQAMESWILSQAKNIQEGLEKQYNKHTDYDLINDELIGGLDVQKIKEPSHVLNQLLVRHFKHIDTGKPLKYGKLKNAPDLINFLTINGLKKDFIDVENLLAKISESTILSTF